MIVGLFEIGKKKSLFKGSVHIFNSIHVHLPHERCVGVGYVRKIEISLLLLLGNKNNKILYYKIINKYNGIN